MDLAALWWVFAQKKKESFLTSGRVGRGQGGSRQGSHPTPYARTVPGLLWAGAAAPCPRAMKEPRSVIGMNQGAFPPETWFSWQFFKLRDDERRNLRESTGKSKELLLFAKYGVLLHCPPKEELPTVLHGAMRGLLVQNIVVYSRCLGVSAVLGHWTHMLRVLLSPQSELRRK